MAYYSLVACLTGLVCLGLMLVKTPFFAFACSTVAVLNVLLDTQRSAEEKQSELIHKLFKMLSWFFCNLFLLIVLAAIFLSSLATYAQFNQIPLIDLDLKSWKFWCSLSLGSVVLLLPVFRKQQRDYSDWSILLHRMILDNRHLSRILFRFEKKIFGRHLDMSQKPFVIVSGLARAGTTAMTRVLYSTNQFHSLTYDDMPFLLCPNLWGTINRSKKSKSQYRAHGDGIEIDFNSIEALEEHFFKVFMNDKFIQTDSLSIHEIDEICYSEYLSYQRLIERKKPGTIYLAKNNNLILRWASFGAHEAPMKVILVFRDPLTHASSLHRQHANFSELQSSDPFILEYMNWLGHHEFGLNHKPFEFQSDLAAQGFYDPGSIEYWLARWIDYYDYVIRQDDLKDCLLVEQADLMSKPRELVEALSRRIGFEVNDLKVPDPKAVNFSEPNCNQQLVDKALDLHRKLQDLKVKTA